MLAKKLALGKRRPFIPNISINETPNGTKHNTIWDIMEMALCCYTGLHNSLTQTCSDLTFCR